VKQWIAAGSAVLFLLSGCVSQTTIENKVPDNTTLNDPSQRAQIRTELAAAYYQRGQMAVALDEAKTAVKHQPNYAPAHNMLGLIHMELREDALATAAFEQAMRLAPNDSDILNNYGWFICQRGDPQRSMTYFQAALKNPLYTTPQRAYLNAGICAKLAGNLPEAERNFRVALQLQPTLAPVLYHLADLSYKGGKYKEAGGYLERYARVLPNPDADVLLLAVRISRALGDKGNEDSYLQQLRRRYPDAPQTRQATGGL
jgi:type IV pilus assembly protein PilF